MPYTVRTELPYGGFIEGHGKDYIRSTDPETGEDIRTPVAATDEEKRAAYIAACERELEGCKRRLMELEQLKTDRPLGMPPPPDWVIEEAEQAKANVVAELKRLASEASDHPKKGAKR